MKRTVQNIKKIQRSNIHSEHKQSQKSQRQLPSYNQHQSNTKKTASCQQIQQKCTLIVNNNLKSSFNPKRTSIDLNSFVQVFRKKVRQTTIAREFQKSLQKFNSFSMNTNKSTRQKGGFIGSCKKQNQLLVENNKLDHQIRKIIISDTEYKDRKLNSKLNFCQEILQKALFTKQTLDIQAQKTNKISRKKITTYTTDQNQKAQNNTISFSKSYLNTEQSVKNPELQDLKSNEKFQLNKEFKQNVINLLEQTIRFNIVIPKTQYDKKAFVQRGEEESKENTYRTMIQMEMIECQKPSLKLNKNNQSD